MLSGERATSSNGNRGGSAAVAGAAQAVADANNLPTIKAVNVPIHCNSVASLQMYAIGLLGLLSLSKCCESLRFVVSLRLNTSPEGKVLMNTICTHDLTG
mmetsp:Transcript_88883/g.147730  ORF Transcript_88883/g.147730 Transcript_88883/m.147730 type:complete len:100 (-) Transcript_88883:100-399(-)